jgi:hypothetical protein
MIATQGVKGFGRPEGSSLPELSPAAPGSMQTVSSIDKEQPSRRFRF